MEKTSIKQYSLSPETVHLRAARIPWVGFLAWHYWYVIDQEGQQERWEVWQRASLIPSSWGHLHQNLMSAEGGVGNGPSWLEATWEGPQAKALIVVLYQSPQAYPHCHRYRYLPGPNSNTYARWVLQQAAVDHSLNWRALGQGYSFR
ncbi:DUF3750 domain-containing protein [Synechocystis sp. LKSZ1]|uniref:DUF3750 domain-containing protein n=1 Tax=Synechocystis sp. LKSZ1 TaxID=3144951 RepID=UPI00336C17C2